MQLDEIHVCSQSLPSGDLLSLSKFPLQDCRRIYLSGNMIKTLEPYSQFHQAEVLEVAKAGIRHLPELMSKVMPCLKELDLSGNSIVDITPLRSLKKLRRLNVMGNDIGDFYEVAKTINGLRTLEILDIRQNPLTALFYTNYLPPTPNSLPGDSPPSSPLKSHNSWLEQDTTYLKTLNDTTYVKRHCYRTTLIYLLQKTITSLDHIPVTESERKGVTHAYNRMKRRLNRVFVRKVYKHVKVNQRGGRGATDEANLKPSRCEDPRPSARSEYVTPRPSTKDNVKQSRNDKVPSTSFAPVVSTGLYDDLTSQTQIMNEIMNILHSPPNALTKLDPALNSNTFQSGSMPPLTLGATPSQAHVEKQDKENYGMKHNEAASAEPMADTRNLSGVFVVQNGMGKELEGRTSSKAMRERQVSESSVNVGMKKAKE
ncbi:hypothetical protein BKA69DRAFT_802108 [Paraphysoderma sedebokerense]|nr:hypothetical protein BKA69DRAFT_802108 [Paraphysoderma sedebokerense]